MPTKQAFVVGDMVGGGPFKQARIQVVLLSSQYSHHTHEYDFVDNCTNPGRREQVRVLVLQIDPPCGNKNAINTLTV